MMGEEKGDTPSRREEQRLMLAGMNPANRPALSVVAPCYDEQEVLPEFVRRVGAVLDGIGGTSEIVLVDDGSRDGTWNVMTEAAARDPRIVAVQLMRNHGHQLALTAGLTVCRGERILIIDADLQDPPELLPDMMALIDQGADVVYGQRRQRDGESLFKRASAAAFYRLIGRLTDVYIPPDTGDFRLMTRRVLDLLLGHARAPPLHPRHGGVDRRQAGAARSTTARRGPPVRANIPWPRWCASPPMPSPPSRWCR